MRIISKTFTNFITCFLLSAMVLNGQDDDFVAPLKLPESSSRDDDGSSPSAAPNIKTFALDPNLKGAVGNSVNLFSGDVNLPVNLVSLPGLNGLGVNVTAVYNSNIQNQVDTWNLTAPTGVLGLGWSLDYPKIVRNHKNTGTRHDDEFYLLAGGSSTPLLRTGTSTNGQTYYYRVKNDPNLEIRYYQEDADDTNGDMGYWEVLTGNGITQVFGNTDDSKQLGIRWKNWIGSSIIATNQTQFAIVWNLSSMRDDWGNAINYDYENVTNTIGAGANAKEYTEASYLGEIRDVYNRKVVFNYGEKSADEEYQDPHKEQGEPDAYQERYETRYLHNIEVYSDANVSDELFSIHFNYNFVGAGNLRKRLLAAIWQTNARMESLPPLKFTYYATGYHRGMLKTVTYTQGGITTYTYTSQDISSVGVSADRDRHVSRPTGYVGKPGIFVGHDYVVLIWENASGTINLETYIWTGRWVKTLDETLDIDDDSDATEYEVFIGEDYFALIEKFHTTQGIKPIHIYHKKEGLKGWYYYTHDLISNHSGCADGGGNNENRMNVAVGDDFISVVSIEHGREYRFQWNAQGETWNSYVSDCRNGDDTDDFYVAGTGNYYFFHNAIGYDRIYFRNRNELGNWTNSSFYLGSNTSDNGDYYQSWHSGSSFFVGLIRGHAEVAYTWDVNFQGFQRHNLGFQVNDVSPTFIRGSFVGIYDSGPNSSQFIRFNGSYWLNETFPGYGFTIGEDFMLTSGIGGIIRLLYNPNLNDYEEFAADNGEYYAYLTGLADQPKVSNNFVVAYHCCDGDNSAGIYVLYRFPGDFEFSEIANFPQTYSSPRVATGSNYFIIQNDDSYTSQFHFVKNGAHVASDAGSDNGKFIHYFDEYDFPDPVGANTAVAIRSGNDATLYRIVNDDFQGAIGDVVVSTMAMDDGYNSVSTSYEFQYGVSDPSGTVAQYNKVIVYPGGDTLNGFTEHYFFNGLETDESAAPFPAGSNVTNADSYYGLMTGRPYKIIAKDANGEVVSTTENYWFVTEFDIGPRKIGHYTRQRKQVSTTDGITKTVESTYAENSGYLTRTQTTNSNGDILTKSFTHFKNAYGDIDNLKSPIVKTITRNTRSGTATTTSATATTWKEWSPGKWAPNKTYTWNGNGSVIFNFSAWSGNVEPPSRWLKVSQVLERTSFGAVRRSADVDSTISSVIFDQTHKRPVAVFSAANISDNSIGNEAGYIGFESGYSTNSHPDNDYWSMPPANTFSTDAHSGKYSRKVIAGTPRYGPTRDFRPDDQYGTYVLSCWVKTEAGYNSSTNSSFKLHTKRDSGNNSLYPSIAAAWISIPIDDTDGKWEYLEVALDLGRVRELGDIPASELLRLRTFTANQDPDHYFLVDDITFRPLDSGFSATIIDPETRRVTARLGNNGETMRTVYDDFNRPLASIGPDEQVNALTMPYYSRYYNWGVLSGSWTEYDPDDPNSVLSITAQNGGIYDGFDDGDADGWTLAPTSHWQVEDGKLKINAHSGDETATAVLESSGAEAMAVSISAAAEFNDSLGVVGMAVGDYSIRCNLIGPDFARWRLYHDGNALVSGTGHAYGRKWTFIISQGMIHFFVDRELRLEYEDANAVGGEVVLFAEPWYGEMAEFDNVLVIHDPVVSRVYSDGMGKTIQSQRLDGDDIILSMPYYDEMNRAAVGFKPIKLDNHALEYNSDLVTAFDWAAGTYTGTMNNFHLADSGFNYTRWEYETTPLARVVKESLPGSGFQIGSGKEISYEYLPDPGETFTGINFDPEEHTIRKIEDPEGVKSVVVEDKLNKTLLKQLEDEDTPTTYSYNVKGQVDTIYLPNYFDSTVPSNEEFTIEMTYDHFGRLKSKATPDGGTERFIYHNRNGQLRFMQDGVGDNFNKVNYYKYDRIGRIKEAGHFAYSGSLNNLQDEANTIPDYPTNAPTWRKKYYYDRAGETGSTINYKGRLWRIETNNDNSSDVEVVETFRYNRGGEIVEKELLVSDYDSTQHYSTSYEYNNVGNVIQIDYPDDETMVAYTYNQLGQLISVGNDSDSYRYAIYIYNPDGSINREILYQSVGSLSHNFRYNSQGRLDGIGPQGGFGFHESIDYSYSGNITTTGMALAQQGPDTLEGVIYNYRTNYTYDDLGQLTGAVHNDNALTDLTMTYDPNGNILTQNNRTYNYISGTNKVRNTDGSGNDYTYNANGNITRANPKNIQQIRYDAFTQMTRRILTSRNITFQYDGSNRRVFRNHRVRVYPPGGGDNPVMKQKYQKGPSEEAVIKDQYSGFSPAQVESKMMGAITWIYNNKLYLHGENAYPLVEYITSTNESETKQVYIYGATGLIATHRDSTTYTIIKDHLGSTRLVLDEDWAVVSWYDYAPFGKISRGGTGTKLNYRYTGQERDGATGLMNYRARMYDPDLGRFYAVDPAGQLASPYAYAGNNPLIMVDPDGEWFFLIPMLFGGAVNYAMSDNPTWKDFAIGAAQGLLTYYSGGGGFGFSMNSAAQAGLDKFAMNTFASMVWDVGYRKSGLSEQVQKEFGMGFDIAFNLLGPAAIEGGLASAVGPAEGVTYDESMTLEEVHEKGMVNYPTKKADIDLMEEGAHFDDTGADWKRGYTVSHGGKTAFVKEKPAYLKKKILGTHYGTSIGPNTEDFTNDPFFIGLITGDGYLSGGISHQSNTRALNALFGTSFLPSQVLGQNFNIGFYQSFMGAGHMPWSLQLHMTGNYVRAYE